MIHALTLAFLSVSAAPGAADPPVGYRLQGDLAIKARHILATYCSECHNPTAKHSSFDILDHKRLVAGGPNPVPFVALKSKTPSQVLEFIEDGSMPPAGRPRPGPDEIKVLQDWVQAGATEFPRAFDDRTVLTAILADLERQPPESVPHLRYVSFAHLIREGQPPPDLAAAEQKLYQALRAATTLNHRVIYEPVDPTATVFRLDIHMLGWDTRDLFSRVEQLKVGDIAPFIPFDLILLEYPYGFTLPPADPFGAKLDAFLQRTRQARPVAFLRADWLADTLGKDKPLAVELRSMVELSGTRERKRKKGVDGPIARPLAGARPIRLPPSGPPGSLPLPPFSAIYARDVLPQPEPFELNVELTDTMAIKSVEAVSTGTRFHVRVSANRKAYFVLLQILADGEVRVLPVYGGNRIDPTAPRLLKSVSGNNFVASSLLTVGASEQMHFIVLAAEDEVPSPTIIRSRHLEAPIWRFVFDPTAGPTRLDQARIVRKVATLTVKQK